ncbi:MAG: rhomboid-like protein [Rhodobacteraceae bacterium HLUCCA08]|nr:MAG: rhomboid-like protein [Rhodobacteraceae bacterium HLUCCA08]
MQSESPFNAIPPVPLALVILIFGIELVFTAGSSGYVAGNSGLGWRSAAIQDWGFSPGVLQWIVERGDYSVGWLKRFVTYGFLHGSFTHALWAAVLLLALGKYVGEVYRPVPFAILFFASLIIGALVYALLSPRNMALIGAYPGIYGLIGAYTYMMWLTLGQLGENQIKAFTLIGMLLGITLVFSLLYGASPAWIAELTGFVTGLLLAPLVAPGGWAAFLRRIRQR